MKLSEFLRDPGGICLCVLWLSFMVEMFLPSGPGEWTWYQLAIMGIIGFAIFVAIIVKLEQRRDRRHAEEMRNLAKLRGDLMSRNGRPAPWHQ